MATTRIFNPAEIHKPVGYSHVAEVTSGKIVYISGQVALDPAGNLVGAGDFRAQTEQVFANLAAAIQAAGTDFSRVVKLNCYCVDSVDPGEIATFRQVRDKFVNVANPPASTFVV